MLDDEKYAFKKEYCDNILKYLSLKKDSIDIDYIYEQNPAYPNGVYEGILTKSNDGENHKNTLLFVIMENGYHHVADSLKPFRWDKYIDNRMKEIVKKFYGIVFCEWEHGYICRVEKIEDYLCKMRFSYLSQKNEKTISCKIKECCVFYRIGNINLSTNEIIPSKKVTIGHVLLPEFEFLYNELNICWMYFNSQQCLFNFIMSYPKSPVSDGFIPVLWALNCSFIVTLCKLLGEDSEKSLSLKDIDPDEFCDKIKDYCSVIETIKLLRHKYYAHMDKEYSNEEMHSHLMQDGIPSEKIEPLLKILSEFAGIYLKKYRETSYPPCGAWNMKEFERTLQWIGNEIDEAHKNDQEELNKYEGIHQNKNQ